ncbi:MAG: hypothetical protein ACI88S_001925, partial [Ilumatobacter sp.]
GMLIVVVGRSHLGTGHSGFRRIQSRETAVAS